MMEIDINSGFVVRLNIFQQCLLLAMKYHCLAQSMVSPEKNPHFFMGMNIHFYFHFHSIYSYSEAILDVIAFLAYKIKSCTSSMLAKKMGCVCSVTKDQVKW